MDKSIAVEHADIAAAETARFGEIMPTSSAISMQSVSIASLRSNGGSYGMACPFFTANGGNQAFVRSCIHAACAVVDSTS